jgi:acetate kinase
MRILVANAGSSSLKLRVLEGDYSVSASADLPPPGVVSREQIRGALASFGRVDVSGHRIVHGGTEFTRAVGVDDEVVAKLEALTDLAPLHQPKSLSVLEAVRESLPAVPAFACFDTAFHSSMPEGASTYAIPRQWRTRWPLKRFGFHGLSHSYSSKRTAELLGRPLESLRIVTCHLGAGASLAAVDGGRSVDTTMGFTPLEGVVMATRSGSVDPGLVLWLQEKGGLSAPEIADALERHSGMAGLAGTDDMRTVIAGAEAGDRTALLALDVYVHRLAAAVASMAAAMNGTDALIFTGGVGQNAPVIRTRTAERLGFLGVALDPSRNEASGDRRIGSGRTEVLVIEAREDLEIAREVREAMAGSA